MTHSLITLTPDQADHLYSTRANDMTAQELATFAKMDKPSITYAYTSDGQHVGGVRWPGGPLVPMYSRLISGVWSDPMPRLLVDGQPIAMDWIVIDKVSIVA